MLNIRGSQDNTSSEYIAVKKLQSMIIGAIPDAIENPNIHFELIPSVRTFGQEIQEVDIVMFFFDSRSDANKFKRPGGRIIKSFALTIEVKSHPFNKIRFEGEKLFVRYKDKDY